MPATEGGWNPMTIEHLQQWCGREIPSEECWNAELDLGWGGSDGSSCSTDTICGVKIGQTSRRYCTLPADVHDFWYRMLRRARFQLTLSVWHCEELRKRADKQHRLMLYDLSLFPPWYLRTAYRRRADVRFYVLRWVGERATRPRSTQGERYAAG